MVAQRLARKLCSHCKRRTIVKPEALADAEIRIGVELEAYEPLGCGRCNQSGYRGRIGIFSVMQLSERIKEMTVDQAPEAEIAAVAREEGMLDLREDGMAKVRSGLTSLEEVLSCHRLIALFGCPVALVGFGYRGIGLGGRSRWP